MSKLKSDKIFFNIPSLKSGMIGRAIEEGIEKNAETG
jgi:hypothetical protein